MKIWKPNTPLAYREAYYTEWTSWLAWYPVKTEQNKWVWGKPVWFRQAYLPLQYRSLPIVIEYSLTKKSRWEADD
jgi:hypothetical protein